MSQGAFRVRKENDGKKTVRPTSIGMATLTHNGHGGFEKGKRAITKAVALKTVLAKVVDLVSLNRARTR